MTESGPWPVLKFLFREDQGGRVRGRGDSNVPFGRYGGSADLGQYLGQYLRENVRENQRFSLLTASLLGGIFEQNVRENVGLRL